MLWIATPCDWYVRTPDKRANPHWQRIQNWMKKAITFGMKLVVFGPPGFPWNIPNIKETISDLELSTTRMRLCHFGASYNTAGLPSGSYMQVATNLDLQGRWKCTCKIPISEHKLDWYGRAQNHAEWRRKVKTTAFGQ